MWYIQTIEFYLPTKKNEIMVHAVVWINLENMFSGVSFWKRNSFYFYKNVLKLDIDGGCITL